MCIHTYIRKPEEIQAETKEKSRISRIHKKKKKKRRRKKERIERYYNFKCNSLGVRPRRPFDLSNSRNDAATP